MAEKVQDAMCYVRKYGCADLFITFTATPDWKELTQQLYPGQTAKDRHDLICRVFNLKLKKLKELIQQKGIFGRVCCHMHTIE